MSVRPSASNNSEAIGQIFIKLDILRKSVENNQYSLISDKNNGVLYMNSDIESTRLPFVNLLKPEF